jgi:hypothetical protein
MDLDPREDDLTTVEPTQHGTTVISNSVEDADIDPALLSCDKHIATASSPSTNTPKRASLSNTNDSARRHSLKQSLSPATAVSPLSRHSARSTHSGINRISPAGNTPTSKRTSAGPTTANGVGATVEAAFSSMSPPASARRSSMLLKSSASPTIPHGLTPEEEASLRVAMQLQAEEFGLRSRRGQSSA